MTDRVLRALKGEKGLVECSYVQSSVIPTLAFFSSPVELGLNGVENIHGIGALDEFEQKKLEELTAELKASIDAGVAFVKANGPAFD
jgi:malate dehydrogenase